LMAATKPSKSSLNTLYTNGGSSSFSIQCCVHQLVLSWGSSRFHCRKSFDLLFSMCPAKYGTHIQYWVNKRNA
jgi:hypothetical protein